MLLNIKGIGPEFAAILWSEGLFRHFDNRRQVASYAGLAPTPWQSGSVSEQGVSKAGNPRLRTTLIQLAWLWLRNQPHSALALWFKDRVSRWRPSQEDDRRGTGTQAADRAVEICDCRSRHRGRHCEERLKGDQKRLKQSTGTRSVSADPGGRTEPVHGLKSRYQEWSHPPEPRPPQAGCWCSRFARRPNVRLIWCGSDQIMGNGLRPWIPKQRPEFHLRD